MIRLVILLVISEPTGTPVESKTNAKLPMQSYSVDFTKKTKMRFRACSSAASQLRLVRIRAELFLHNFLRKRSFFCIFSHIRGLLVHIQGVGGLLALASMQYIDKESCHRLSETPPVL